MRKVSLCGAKTCVCCWLSGGWDYPSLAIRDWIKDKVYATSFWFDTENFGFLSAQPFFICFNNHFVLHFVRGDVSREFISMQRRLQIALNLKVESKPFRFTVDMPDLYVVLLLNQHSNVTYLFTIVVNEILITFTSPYILPCEAKTCELDAYRSKNVSSTREIFAIDIFVLDTNHSNTFLCSDFFYQWKRKLSAINDSTTDLFVIFGRTRIH